MERIVRDRLGSFQRGFVERGRWFRVTGQRGDEQAIEIGIEMEALQNWSQRDTPVRNRAKRIAFTGLESLQCYQDVGIYLPACMRIVLMMNNQRKLAQTRLVLLFNQGSQHIHVVH